jgi:TM2 domain-containing membrane protein YozV
MQNDIEQLKALKDLLDSGIITQDEFDAKKTQILNAAPCASDASQAAQETQLGEKNKLAAGLLAIFLGWLGVHKFYLGYTKEGLIMLLVSLLTFFIGAWVMEIIGFVEGILYLTKTDQDFYETYELNKKPWF